MKWFKHQASANMDAKLQEVLLDYGLEGYGLYWYCLELIAGNVEADNLTFELEHDCRIIARNVGSTSQKVQEMMTAFINFGLFEEAQGTITCLKLAKVSDDYTAKLVRSKPAQALDFKENLQTPTKTEKDPLDKNKTEENREEENILDNTTVTVVPEKKARIAKSILGNDSMKNIQKQDAVGLMQQLGKKQSKSVYQSLTSWTCLTMLLNAKLAAHNGTKDSFKA